VNSVRLRSVAFALAVASALMLAMPWPAAATDEPVLVGTVTKVTDGDTIRVRLSSGPIVVRLDSIDTPERDQPWGREAAAALARLVANRQVELDVVSQDRYERLVAQVNVGGVNVNEQLVRDGHAWAYRRYMKKATGPRFCALEAAARSAHRGLWSLPDGDWIYPSEWRRLQRGTTSEYDDYRQESVADCVRAIGKR
jgi:endonuclease YncB( thermonuclease family)